MGSVNPGGWVLRSALLSAQGGGFPALDRLARDEVRTGLAAYILVELIRRIGLDRNNRGQCGLAMPRTLGGVNPPRVTASHEPGIEPCREPGNRHADA